MSSEQGLYYLFIMVEITERKLLVNGCQIDVPISGEPFSDQDVLVSEMADRSLTTDNRGLYSVCIGCW
jgi:hypothetical protein